MTPPISPTPAVPAPSEKELREPHPSIAHVRQLFPEDAYVAWKKEHKHHTDCPYGDVKLCAFMSGIGYAVDHLKPPAPSVDVKQERKRWIPISDQLPSGTAEVLYWDGEEVGMFVPEAGEHPIHQPKLRCSQFGVTHWIPLPAPPSILEPEADVSEDVKAVLGNALSFIEEIAGDCFDVSESPGIERAEIRTWISVGKRCKAFAERQQKLLSSHASNSPAVRVEAEPEACDHVFQSDGAPCDKCGKTVAEMTDFQYNSVPAPRQNEDE